MGAQADARRQVGFIVALMVPVLLIALWLWRQGDGDIPFIFALFFAVWVAWLVAIVVLKVLLFVLEELPGLAKFLRDLSGKNG